MSIRGRAEDVAGLSPDESRAIMSRAEVTIRGVWRSLMVNAVGWPSIREGIVQTVPRTGPTTGPRIGTDPY
jgi:hypothetical protein